MRRSAPATTLVVLTLAAVGPIGCGSDDDSSSPERGSTTTSSIAQGEITSSIREGAELADAVRWHARLSGVSVDEVSDVRFLIDGKVEHVEGLAPYEFAGTGNRLLPGTLAPGSHTFAVHARLAGGDRLTAASTATVSPRAQPIPAAVVGTWTRTVAPADVRRTEGLRNPEHGGIPLPVGRWTVEIGADGMARYTDPFRREGSLTVGQVRFEPGGSLIVGNEIPNVAGAGGGFCPDTVGTGAYGWAVSGDNLVVDVLDDRECADRNSFWNGTFRRTEER